MIATYAVMRFDGTVLPRNVAHSWAAAAVALVLVGATAGLLSLSFLVLFGVLLFAGAYAKVTLDRGLFERQSNAEERRRGWVALVVALAALGALITLWLANR